MSYKIASPLASYTVDELVSSKAGPQGTAAYDEMVYDPVAQDRLSAEFSLSLEVSAEITTVILVDLSGSTGQGIGQEWPSGESYSMADLFYEEVKALVRALPNRDVVILGYGSHNGDGWLGEEHGRYTRRLSLDRDESWSSMGGTIPISSELIQAIHTKLGGYGTFAHTPIQIINISDGLPMDYLPLNLSLSAETFNAPRKSDLEMCRDWNRQYNAFQDAVYKIDEERGTSVGNKAWEIVREDFGDSFMAEEYGGEWFQNMVTTPSGHEVEWDDGSIYIEFAEPIRNWKTDSVNEGRGYTSVTGDWYGGDNESPDKFSLTVTNPDADYADFTIDINDVEYYGVSQNKHNRWQIDGDYRGNAPDIFVDMSDDLVAAIEEGLNWMVGGFEEYNAEEFGAQTEAKRALKLLRRKSSKQRTQNRKQARKVKADKYGSEKRAETVTENKKDNHGGEWTLTYTEPPLGEQPNEIIATTPMWSHENKDFSDVFTINLKRIPDSTLLRGGIQESPTGYWWVVSSDVWKRNGKNYPYYFSRYDDIWNWLHSDEFYDFPYLAESFSAETDSSKGFIADAKYGAGATFGVIGALFTGGFLMSLLGRRS